MAAAHLSKPLTASLACVDLLLQSSSLNGLLRYSLAVSTTTQPLPKAIPFMRSVQSWRYLITLSALSSTFGGIVRAICFAVPRPAGGIFPFTIGMASSNYAADTLFNFRTKGGDT